MRLFASAGLLELAVPPAETADALAAAVVEPDLRVRANVVGTLAKLPEVRGDVIAALAESVAAPSGGLRRRVAELFARSDSAAARSGLIAFLADPSVRVRLVAATGLMEHGEVEIAADALAGLLATGSRAVVRRVQTLVKSRADVLAPFADRFPNGWGAFLQRAAAPAVPAPTGSRAEREPVTAARLPA